jgi:hypothetical protein
MPWDKLTGAVQTTLPDELLDLALRDDRLIEVHADSIVEIVGLGAVNAALAFQESVQRGGGTGAEHTAGSEDDLVQREVPLMMKCCASQMKRMNNVTDKQDWMSSLSVR